MGGNGGLGGCTRLASRKDVCPVDLLLRLCRCHNSSTRTTTAAVASLALLDLEFSGVQLAAIWSALCFCLSRKVHFG